MLVIFENENNYATVFYNEAFVPSEELSKGLVVKELPPEETFENKRAVLKVDVANERLWYEYVDAIVDLTEARELKIAKLNSSCDQSIESGFISGLNNHRYRTNRDDQINFIGQKDELTNDATIATVMWKTEDAGYVEHTREDWLAIYYEGLAHKKSQLFKYDQLKQQVLTATTVEEINAINW